MTPGVEVPLLPLYISPMDSIRALMDGLIDYAGLFPPAELGMREAVVNYAEYFNGPDSASLGRFIVPAELLEEFESVAKDLLPRGREAKPWEISVLAKSDTAAALRGLERINIEAAGADGLRVGAIEVQFASLPQLPVLDPNEFRDFTGFPAHETYVELSASENLDDALIQLKQAGFGAKLRTGGVTSNAFPTTGQVVRFMRACCDAGLAFKATAGLHHPLRAPYRLTYEADSATATMFGFLNLFLGAAFMFNRADDVTVSRILEETDSSSFTFSGQGISWRDKSLSTNRIAATRKSFAHSFGSCSFREPVDELKLLASPAVTA